MQNSGHGLNFDQLVFYVGKHIGTGNSVPAVSPHITPKHTNTMINTLLTKTKQSSGLSFGCSEEGGVRVQLVS